MDFGEASSYTPHGLLRIHALGMFRLNKERSVVLAPAVKRDAVLLRAAPFLAEKVGRRHPHCADNP